MRILWRILFIMALAVLLIGFVSAQDTVTLRPIYDWNQDADSGTVRFADAHPVVDELVISTSQSKIVRWDLTDGTRHVMPYENNPDYTASIDRVFYLPDERLLISREDVLIQITDLDLVVLETLWADKSYIRQIDLLPDGEHVALATETGAAVLALNDTVETVGFTMPDDLPWVNATYAGADGESVFVWAYWGGIENPDSLLRFDIDTGKVTNRFFTGTIESFASSPVNSSFARVTGGFNGAQAYHGLIVADDAVLYSQNLSSECGRGAVTYSADGSVLALAAEGALTVLDSRTFDVLTNAEIPCEPVYALTFTATGHYLALFQGGGSGIVYEVVRE